MPGNPNYKDTATRFKEGYNQPLGQVGGGPQNPSGITNARIATEGRRQTQSAKRRGNQRNYLREDIDENNVRNNVVRERVRQTLQTEEANKIAQQAGLLGTFSTKVKGLLTKASATGLGTFFTLICYPIWQFILLWAGILATISFGIAWGISYYSSTSGGIIDPLIEGSGLGFETFLLLYFLFSLFIFVFNFLQLAIALPIYKMGLVHPIIGKSGAALKISAIFIIIIGSWIPILNCFPLVLFWVWAVKFYPE